MGTQGGKEEGGAEREGEGEREEAPYLELHEIGIRGVEFSPNRKLRPVGDILR